MRLSLTSLVLFGVLLVAVAPIYADDSAIPGVQIRMQVTAYCYSKAKPIMCDHSYSLQWGNRGQTASGKHARVGMCAADWDIFPPGTLFDVPGYGHCTVEDRGSAIRGRALDVFLLTPYAARQWGRQDLLVTLLRWGRP